MIAGAATSAKLAPPVFMAANVVRLLLLTAAVPLDARLAVAPPPVVDEELPVEVFAVVELLLDELLADVPPSAIVVTPLVEPNVKSAWTD
ncbi:MAG TPA: hypothetical protein VJ787_12880 [Thermoleophilia bacterium]|nr:hypothetical protein [Thermoleophilia bacterium]